MISRRGPHYGNTEHGRAQFPTGADALDRLIENDGYLDVFEQCLGAEASYCNAHLFMRSGPTDERHAEHPWQGYHIDHYTNCFLPPSRGVGAFDYVNSGVYLHDVEEDGAPMHVIPGSHRQAVELRPCARAAVRPYPRANSGNSSSWICAACRRWTRRLSPAVSTMVG